ncbi:ABC transporter ATP-binding protein [Methanolobus psychrotolerans]|uniref:ABC transporter ATP-binding protein n=1 Tax=Methanolobus psychrotolerans TaxID=1874706 RepID=UPI000B91B25D|nr:ATP-binding cassette domain-containing protein [Methanolobus psychrotolerans]
MEVLNIHNLSVQYGGKSILSDFNLLVGRGDKILIKGQSGVGKSTLLRQIMGFGMQSSGTIYLNGVLLDRDSIWDLRKRVAYVSQDTDIGEGQVSELLDEVFSFKANRDVFDRNKLDELLSYLSLPHEILKKEYMKLSGGEKQRITLVMALLSCKDIFLLDEVTAELDSILKKKVVDLFFGNPEWTVLAISHDREWEYLNTGDAGTGGIRVIDFSAEAN